MNNRNLVKIIGMLSLVLGKLPPGRLFPGRLPLPNPNPNPNPVPGKNLLKGNLPGGNFPVTVIFSQYKTKLDDKSKILK